MPKKIYNQSDFSGGIDGITSPRDVADNKVILAKSVYFDQKGKIRMMGKSLISEEFHTTSMDNPAFDSGTSIYYFTHDYSILSAADTIDTSPDLIDGEFIVVGNQEHIAIYDIIRGFWYEEAIDMGTDPGVNSRKVAFYFSNAALRCYNTLMHANHKTRWFGHIKRTLFEDSGGEKALDFWYTTTTKLLAPSNYYDFTDYSNTIGSETPGYTKFLDDANTTVEKTADTLTVHYTDIGTGTWIAGLYRLYLSFIYDGSQESPVHDAETYVGANWTFADGTDRWNTSTAHGLAMGDAIVFKSQAGGTNPTTYSLDTIYYVEEVVDADTVKLSATALGGASGTPLEGNGSDSDGNWTAINANNYANVAADVGLRMAVTIDYALSSGAPIDFNARITGARVYYSDPVDGHGTKYHLLDIDFVKGCRKFDESSFTPWVNSSSNNYECPSGIISGSLKLAAHPGVFVFEDMPKSVTYDMLNGYSPDEVTDAEFRCHTIFNNRIYIGNIKQDGKTYPDRIIRSPINFEGNPQYDTFPASHKMDVAANDGDAIKALEGFGDRLLIFKKKSVYVINVAQDGAEFVESKFTDLGVQSPSQVTTSEYGVIWINDKGCYLYREGQPINLIENTVGYAGRFISASMKWKISEDKYPAVIYTPRHNKIIVSYGMADGYSNDGWVYDFPTKSWSMGAGIIGDYSKVRSNFIMDDKGVPHFGQLDSGTLDLYRWSDESQAHNEFALYFKDIDFGQPDVRKKVYKAYLSFRAGSETNVIAKYVVNGNYDNLKTFADSANSISSNELVFDSTTANLLENGDFLSNPSGLILAALAGDGTEFGSTDWHSREQNDGALGLIRNGSMTWYNDADSDVIMFQSQAVTSGTSYRIEYKSNTVQAGVLVGTTLYLSNPRIMCFVSTGSGGTAHSDLTDNANQKGFIVSSTQDVVSFTFTADANATWYICFRSVDYNGTDPTAFTSFRPADENALILDNRVSVSNVRMKNQSDWTRAELKPSTASDANNIHSFGLKLDVQTAGTTYVPGDFEIDNLSVVYRPKNIK